VDLKTCKKCFENKLVCEFYDHPTAKDGLRGACIDCTIEYHRRRRVTNRRGVLSINRSSVAKYAAKNPEKIAAKNLVQKAIRDGKIERGVCEVCGSDHPEAHHDNYGLPLSVRWLCRRHHKAHHRENGPGLTGIQ